MKLQDLEFNKVFLIGMPFSGKTSTAKKLAKLLAWDYVDSDKEISKSENLSIEEIFVQKGEIYFRKLENSWLQDANNLSNVVISTGGGMPIFYNNIELMLHNGIVIFLNTRAQILAERSLLNNDRPLVKHVSEDLDMRMEFFNKMLFERLPYYSKAHYTLNSEAQILELFSK